MKQVIYLLAGATLMFTACGNEESREDAAENMETTETVIKATPVSMTEVKGSPDFFNATISLNNVSTEPDGENVKVTFDFGVKNYALKKQTEDAEIKMCNNSAQGQHIHFILDNEPYAALYDPTHTVSLAKNTEHYLLAFLSRSYHESLKNKEAVLMYHFKIDENGKVVKLDDPGTPMVFYSRPKGNYVGEADMANLLFDFYPWNTELSGNGNKVLAQIQADNIDTTIRVDKWQAYFLHNLPAGKPKITLTLVDKDGNKINGPMTEVTREFTLAVEEPLPQ